ncbi:MAG: TetR/AcrR family transcriptional regulator [Bacteroidia bacterium]|nr:TetR/AcrR family transcriptional regulator [Bacteroidia bacterium]
MTRKELIINTARKQIVQHGLYDASIGKIARAANIPVGSVYTYFDSKESLIHEIFLQAKGEMNAFIFAEPISAADDKAEMYIYWERAITYGLAHQEQFFFLEQYINSPLVLHQSQTAIRAQFVRTYALLQRGLDAGYLKPLPVDVLHSVIYTHIVGMIKLFCQQPEAFSHTCPPVLFETCWDGLLRHEG